MRVISKHTKIDTLFDSGSQEKLISEDLVKKVNLETIPHPEPYPLGWICKDANLQVSKKCSKKICKDANLIGISALE